MKNYDRAKTLWMPQDIHIGSQTIGEKINQCKVALVSKHLSKEVRVMLHGVLSTYTLIFERTLVTWKNNLVDIKIQPNAKTYHTYLYPVPR